MDKIFCPECGCTELIRNYNYDTANVEYECQFCDHCFTDRELVFCEDCGKQIMSGISITLNGDVLCSNCAKKQ